MLAVMVATRWAGNKDNRDYDEEEPGNSDYLGAMRRVGRYLQKTATMVPHASWGRGN